MFVYFPGSQILSDFEETFRKRVMPWPGFEPRTFSIWSQCATILPRPLHSEFAKSWEVIPIFVYFAGSQKLSEKSRNLSPFFCFKYFSLIWSILVHFCFFDAIESHLHNPRWFYKADSIRGKNFCHTHWKVAEPAIVWFNFEYIKKDRVRVSSFSLSNYIATNWLVLSFSSTMR